MGNLAPLSGEDGLTLIPNKEVDRPRARITEPFYSGV